MSPSSCCGLLVHDLFAGRREFSCSEQGYTSCTCTPITLSSHTIPSHCHTITPSSHTPSQTPQQSQYAEEAIPVLTAAERARTVNAKGEYIDHRYISSFRSSNSHFDGTLHSGYFSLSVSLREARSLVTCAEPPTLLPDCHPLPLPPPPLPPPN